MRSATADIESSPDLWSSPRLVTGSTLPRRPDSPPRMCRGCFEAVIHPEHRDIYVYWTKTEPRYHNGPNFEYVARRLDRETVDETIVRSSYAGFSNISLSEIFSFNVTSRNDEGEAVLLPYSLSVPPQDLIDQISPQAVTIIYRENFNKITVSWIRPKAFNSSEDILSYTVFWCEKVRFSDSFCQTVLHFENVYPYDDNHLSSVLTKANDSSDETQMYHLNLPIEKEYRIAVAANTRKQQISSGIVWSSYEIIKNNNDKVVNIRVAERGSRKQQVPSFGCLACIDFVLWVGMIINIMFSTINRQ